MLLSTDICVLPLHCRYCAIFFFQAEDGIRDLVRSRGLGDVYKRQGQVGASVAESLVSEANDITVVDTDALRLTTLQDPVSYTHLTLPTSDLV